MPKHIRLSLRSPPEPGLSVLLVRRASVDCRLVVRSAKYLNAQYCSWLLEAGSRASCRISKMCQTRVVPPRMMLSSLSGDSNMRCTVSWGCEMFSPAVEPQIQTCVSENLSSQALSVGDAEGFRPTNRVPRLIIN